MTPIDDELRAALHGRALSLAPAPDPLAGIERRARRIQRNRIGAAVAGSALAVAAVAAVVPALQGATSPEGPRPPTVASAEPAPSPSPATASYALDPTAPWQFRGEPVVEGTRATIQREYATRVQGAEVLVTPLFAQVYEPSGQLEVVFLAEVDGAYRWGVAQSSESGPEFLWDAELASDTVALAAALPGDEVARLLVVASPESSAAFYRDDDTSEFVDMAELAPGVSTLALEGDPATDSYRVDLPGRQEILPAPDLPGAPEPERPGPEVDGAAYAFDAGDPWGYRGPAELRAANLTVDGERLFVATDPSRGDGSWSQRPLYAADSDAGVSLLVLLHTKAGEEPVVTTTWQRGDRAAEQTEQRVEPGQPLVQSIVPTDLDDGSVLLVALASPQVGGIVLDQPSGNRPDGIGFPGVGLWVLAQGQREGMIRLYTEGDGVEFYAEPVDVGPGGR